MYRILHRRVSEISNGNGTHNMSYLCITHEAVLVTFDRYPWVACIPTSTHSLGEWISGVFYFSESEVVLPTERWDVVRHDEDSKSDGWVL